MARYKRISMPVSRKKGVSPMGHPVLNHVTTFTQNERSELGSHELKIGKLRQLVSTQLPTKWGAFQLLGFDREVINGSRHTETALAISLGDPREGAPLVRVHSQCFTSEVLGSLRCDCN